MEEILAYCGIVCTECPAYPATQAGDDEHLGHVAQEWSNEDLKLEPADLLCDGCLPGATRYAVFCSECGARLCALARGLPNCAHCEDFGCEKLRTTFEMVPDAKVRLDRIRDSL
ncbi:MAG: DUF3795 domain-containing protein [Anaerolineae bacterium]|nr:DUF3795 domain-containing protein [Anaerolineae bacterium]